MTRAIRARPCARGSRRLILSFSSDTTTRRLGRAAGCPDFEAKYPNANNAGGECYCVTGEQYCRSINSGYWEYCERVRVYFRVIFFFWNNGYISCGL